jgi:large subunit ribosomal protein L25
MQQETLRATKRETAGSRPSRRLRRDGRVPAIVYGSETDSIAIHVAAGDLYTILHTEAGMNAIIEVEVEGKSVLTVAREIYRHPVKGDIEHLDFIEVSLDTEIEAEVSIDFIGIPVGVTEEGGIVQIIQPSVTINALPNAIPSSIELDIAEMELHDTMTVADLPEIDGVTYVTEADYAVVSVSVPAAEIVEEPELVEGEEGIEGEEGEEGIEGEERSDEGASKDEG